jgi:EAL domain-containing protein (putative c-di-GMP-specific phosphodiesterase class I)
MKSIQAGMVMSIRKADLISLFPNISTAQSGLEMLRATACDIDALGQLSWVNSTAAASLLGLSQIPLTLLALDAITEGGVSLALNANQPVALTSHKNIEVRGDSGRGVLVFRNVVEVQPILAMPLPANDPGTLMLISALADKRLCLFRQPIVSALDASLIRFECLSRLVHEDGRIAQPYEFIPAAERAGLVGALDLETLQLALKALGRETDVKLAVNVSAATIADQGSRRAYKDLLAFNGALATRLTIEITETIAIHDLDIAARFGHAAKAAGARLALDDFGEGHTSFQSLRTLPLDEVKIDGLYVEGIDARAENKAFVIAIDRLARDLGMETVAERVETVGEVNALREIGVDGLQGYYYGKPRSAG